MTTSGLILPFETKEQKEARIQAENEHQRAQRIFSLAPDKFKQAVNLLAQHHELEVRAQAVNVAAALLREQFGWTEQIAFKFMQVMAARMGLTIMAAGQEQSSGEAEKETPPAGA